MSVRDVRGAIFDLFGTLVDAPSPAERAEAAAELAPILGVSPQEAERIFIGSWTQRHDGTLATLSTLAGFLWSHTRPRGTSHPKPPPELAVALRRQATSRLTPPADVVAVLRRLRHEGLRIGVLSDASADIAESWPDSAFVQLVDVAVFSCVAGVVKPHPALYRQVLDRLGTAAEHTLYFGDGGGDELRGAQAVGMRAFRVRRRGEEDCLVFGEARWDGPALDNVGELVDLLGRERAV